MDKQQKMKTMLENFRMYWNCRETFECFLGISVLMDDENWAGKKLTFDPNDAPIISLDNESWQVNSLPYSMEKRSQ